MKMIKHDTKHQFTTKQQIKISIFVRLFLNVYKNLDLQFKYFLMPKTMLSRKYADSPLAWVEIIQQ